MMFQTGEQTRTNTKTTSIYQGVIYIQNDSIRQSEIIMKKKRKLN